MMRTSRAMAELYSTTRREIFCQGSFFRQLVITHSVSTAPALVYERHGPPKGVIQLLSVPVEPLGQDDLQLDMIAAPVNPSDINQIEGKYPIKPPLPAIGGNEGLGVVRQRGAQVRGMAEGDWVVPLTAGQGTWRQKGVFRATDWHRVPSDLPPHLAAQLAVNPVSALRMLQEFSELKEGDVVVQNGANSAVGQAVIQIAAARGIKTVNLVRDRPDMQQLREELQRLGATIVTTEQDLKQDLAGSELPRPALGLNCVGGSSSAAVAKTLRPGGTIVSYGGMSMQPVTIPTSLFIFKDLRARGFWLSGDDKSDNSRQKKAGAIDQIVELVQQGKFQAAAAETPFRQFWEALSGGKGKKKSMLMFQDA